MSESNLGSKQDKLNSEELVQDKEDKQRRRRTRNDDDGRNFTCSCGKSYLSYPALYTHVKTKHNGKPEFTRNINPKQDHSYDAKDDEVSEPEKYEDTNNMDLLKKYLTKFFPFSQKQKEADRKIKQISKEDQIYIKSIKEYWEKHRKEDEPQLNEAYATTVDFVLGKFLLDIENEVSKICQRFLHEFVLNLRNALNELQKNDKFCKTSCAASLPLLMNNVFVDYFQKMEDTHIYRRHPTIPCKLLFHFNRWLFQEKFTNQSLKFNTV